MNKIATFLSEKLAGKLDDLAHRDMREWPPTSVPIYYQPQRPQRETDDTNKQINVTALYKYNSDMINLYAIERSSQTKYKEQNKKPVVKS